MIIKFLGFGQRSGLFFLSVVILLSLSSEVAVAQGCAMCQTSAGAQSEKGIQALNHAILFLLAPTVCIMSAIFICAFRRATADEADG